MDFFLFVDGGFCGDFIVCVGDFVVGDFIVCVGDFVVGDFIVGDLTTDRVGDATLPLECRGGRNISVFFIVKSAGF
jgi:hypothetical protein